MKEEAKKAFEEIVKYVNRFGNKYENFVDLMKSEHRTLQQSFTRLCVKWLLDLAERQYFDDRNKASVELGKKFKERLGDECHLPLI